MSKVKNYLEGKEEKYKNENLRDVVIFYLGIDCGLRRMGFIALTTKG